jgi:hypothetical protein
MTRRTWLSLLPSALAAPPAQDPPPGLRIPFGWRGVSLATPLQLPLAKSGRLLRITTALDSREVQRVEVTATSTGEQLGVFDLRFAPAGQIHELSLPKTVRAVELRQVPGSKPVWILKARAPKQLLPHCIEERAARHPQSEFLARLRGIESVQPFGWMEGCVLDALSDLRSTKALDAHLRLFLPDDRNLIYEDPLSKPADNRFLNIEETLPLAAIAQRRPKHSAIALARSYWQEHRDAEGCVISGGLTSTEGSYTVAYPMAAVARTQRDKALEDLAIRQLRVRRDRLATPEAIHLRRDAKGRMTFRNWSRGIAWYLLGLVRTLELLRDRTDIEDLRAELIRSLTWALRYRGSDGLWPCFADDPSTGAETSGSAGIAAALAKASRLGLAPPGSLEIARSTARTLESWLTPDGFLRGVSQSNRGGEALQRSGYRVISPMAMGLAGQLHAAVNAR